MFMSVCVGGGGGGGGGAAVCVFAPPVTDKPPRHWYVRAYVLAGSMDRIEMMPTEFGLLLKPLLLLQTARYAMLWVL